MSVLNTIFDEVWVLNCREDVGRMRHFESQAKSIFLKYERFDAYGPARLVEDGHFGPNMVKLPLTCSFVRKYGCSLSHSTLVNEVARRSKTLCIFEDDVEFLPGFESTVETAFEARPPLGLYFVHCNFDKGLRLLHNEHWYEMFNNFYGMYAIAFLDVENQQLYAKHAAMSIGVCIDAALRSTYTGRTFRIAKNVARQNKKFKSRINRRIGGRGALANWS